MSEFSFRDLLGNAEGFKVIAEGPREAVVDRAEVRQSKKGKVMYAVMFKVDGGPDDGHAVWTNLTVSPESPTALGIFFRQMAALGLGSDFFVADPTPEQVAHALEGRRGLVTIGVEEYPLGSGNTKNTISGIKRSAVAVEDALAAPAPAAAASDPAAAASADAAPSAPPTSPF